LIKGTFGQKEPNCSQFGSLFWREKRVKGLLLSFLLLLNGAASARTFPKIELAGPLKFELNSVLLTTTKLHDACFEAKDREVDSAIAEVIKSIDVVKRRVQSSPKEYEYLSRVLDSARSQLESSRGKAGEDRRTSLQEAFRELVQISQMFKLDAYKVFFCPSDKSVWFQKESRPKNPIHPDKYANCGKLVP
jgi:hypothetical protein